MRHHVFVVSGWSDQALSEFVPTGETVEKLTYTYKMASFVIDWMKGTSIMKRDLSDWKEII
jgi:hypothetical protein